ncbi:hypothetical protein M9458_023613, partial [Cirrhinus mrigala]
PDLLLFALNFTHLAVTSPLDDEIMKSLFQIRANYHHPVDLPDATGLSWRESVFCCLESVLPLSGKRQDPEPSPPSPRFTELQPEPTVDRESGAFATHEPTQEGTTELGIAPGARARASSIVLLAPSCPLSPIGPPPPPPPPGSLVPPAPPWSVVDPPSAQDSALPAPRRSILTGSFGLLPPSSSTLVLSHSGSALPDSSASPWLVGSPSLPRTPPPPAFSLSVGLLESATRPPPWLLPPLAPPWPAIMAVAWVPPGSSCSKSLLSSPWLITPLSPPWTLFVVLLPGVCPPLEPPLVLSACLPASPLRSPVTIPHPLLCPPPNCSCRARNCV